AGGPAERRAAARWMTRPIAFLTAGAAAVVLLLAGIVLGATIRGTSPEQQHAAAFAELNAAPDVERLRAPGEGGGTATLVFSEQLARSAVVWEDLPPLEGDRVYELWYITEGPVAAGVFDPEELPGNFRVLDGELHEGAQVGITIEPVGGSELPSTEPI